MRMTGVATILLMLPAAAGAEWSHKASGVQVPDQIGDMTKSETRESPDGLQSDISAQYGSAAEPVTLWVYRASQPNPALWFERTRIAMLENVGQFDTTAGPKSFTIGGAPTANGLREEFAINTGGPWKVTAVAIAQAGEWTVKARITSKTLDKAGVAARMDRLLAAIRFTKPIANAPPLIVPAPCATASTFAGKLKNDKKIVTNAAIVGLIVNADARGTGDGVASKPNLWCHEDGGPTNKMMTYYRRVDGTAWTALMGDAGISINGTTIPAAVGGGAGVYVIGKGDTLVAAMFDALPGYASGIDAAVRVFSGQTPALATISVSPAKDAR